MNRSSNPRNPTPASAHARSGDGGESPSADKIRLLIADDHMTVLAGLASIIGMQQDMIVVAEAANGRQAVDLWRKHRPDVTLLDLRMPKRDPSLWFRAFLTTNRSSPASRLQPSRARWKLLFGLPQLSFLRDCVSMW